MPRSAEHGRTSTRQLYEAACAAIPNQGSRKEHLLLADIKKALGTLPDVDTSDTAVQAVFDMLVVHGNISYDATKETYLILDRSPHAGDTEDSDIDDMFADMADDDTADESPAAVPDTDSPVLSVDEEIDEMFASMGDDDTSGSSATATTAPTTVATATTTSARPTTTTSASSPHPTGTPDTTRRASEAETTTPSSDTPPRAAEPAVPPNVPHHTAVYSERRFARWANQVQDIHTDLLRIVSNVDVGALDNLKAQFRELTGAEWHESFPVHQFLAEKKSTRTETRETDPETKEGQYSRAVAAYQEKLIALFTELGPPVARSTDRELGEITTYIRTHGVGAQEAITEFVEDLRDELVATHQGDVVRGERELYFMLAKMTDKTLAYHMERSYQGAPEEPASLIQAREAFLQAQEDLNEFERKILRNPFTSGKKKQALIEALHVAREAYNIESAKMIAGRSHRFLNEYNRQIDAEIDIRDERRAARGGDGVMSKLKDTFYGMYKWLGDQSLDKAYQAQKGEEPKKGRWIRKAANLRTAIGAGLGMLGLGTAWRAAAGLGAGIGVYEGLKAKATASIQQEAQRILSERNPANVSQNDIYDVLQQIRMRAALDGKSVTDTNFSLHKSFAGLRELLQARQDAIPPETREQAYGNLAQINAALDTINAQLEEQIMKQADKRRKHILAAVAVGGATAVATPYILKGLGIAAEEIAEWWVGDPAVSDTLEAGTGSSVRPATPEVTPVPALPDLPGDGLRAVVDRGEGAYHAVYKLMDQLTPADRAAFVDTIAERHPEWVQRDGSGAITNADRILRNWRMEAVSEVHLDSGDTVSAYNAATREYGVMLHPNAQFSLEYDANGYPQLHLHGDEATGRYRILDEALVRHVAQDGDVSFVPSDEVPIEPTEDIPARTNLPTSESILESAPHIGAQADALGAETIAPMSEVGSTAATDTASGDMGSTSRSDIRGTGQTVSGNEQLPTEETTRTINQPVTRTEATMSPEAVSMVTDSASTSPEVVSESMGRIEGANGRYIQFSYDDEGHIVPNDLDMKITMVTQRMMAEPVRDSAMLFVGMEDGNQTLLDHVERSRLETYLRQMYVFDEAMDTLRAQGQSTSQEFRLLDRLYSRLMERVADIKGQSVQEVFTNDVLREHGFELPERDLAESSAVPEVGAVTMPTVDTAILAQVQELYPNLSDINRDVVRTLQAEYEQGIANWDTMTPTEQSAFTERVAQIAAEFDYLRRTVAPNS